MYLRLSPVWFKNATWKVLRMNERSTTTALLRGNPEYASAFGPERHMIIVLLPSAVPVTRKETSDDFEKFSRGGSKIRSWPKS